LSQRPNVYAQGGDLCPRSAIGVKKLLDTADAGKRAGGEWLERGLAWVDAAGHIERLDDALTQWIERGAVDLRGENLAQTLAGKCPDATEVLAPIFNGSSSFAEVTLHCGEDSAVQIEAARNSAGWFLRLHSVLPSTRELAERGWTEELAGKNERHELFVRALKAESELERLAQSWPGVVFNQRPDFSFRFISPRVEELTGIPAEQWMRSPRTFWQAIHETDADEVQRQIRRAAETGESIAIHYRVRHVQSGKVTYLLEHRRPLRSASGLLLSYEGVWLDVTRQTIAEKRLSAAAWKETLALLTMGLAHDFNNILAGITSLSETFLAECDANHPFKEGLTLIRGNALQASQLVHRIMSLHRSKTGERNYHNLNEVVTEFSDLVKKILPRRIHVREELTPAALAVYADAVELRQVVLNLALNAADAMPDRGELVFRTSVHNTWTPPEHFVGIEPRTPIVCLEVADTGSGIPERHLPLLFDPFFTTKPLNKGSGLGLYNARLFVEKHHGGISVASIETKGTTFRLWLAQADFSESERAQAAGPRRSILLLGDSGLLLDSTTEFLRMSGYYVVQTSTLDRTRDLLLGDDHTFAALMVLADPRDAGLPGLLRDTKKRLPDLKIVLQTVGGTADELDTEWLALGHLVITSGMSEADILKNLDTLLR